MIDGVVYIIVAVSIIGVVVIALVTVGDVVGKLSRQPALRIFSLEEAVDFVADRLPDAASAQLSYDDVRVLIGWHMDYLEQRGVARDSTVPTPKSGLEASSEPGPAQVVSDHEALAWVLGQLSEGDGLPDLGHDVDDRFVVDVLDANDEYLIAIGALGDEIDGPVDPLALDGNAVDQVDSSPE